MKIARLSSFFVGLALILVATVSTNLLLLEETDYLLPSLLVFWVIYTRYSLKKIELDPLQNVAVTFMGRFTEEILKPGWHLFPGNPFFWNFISFDPTKVTTTISVDANTPDTVALKIDVDLEYAVDPDNYLNYLQSGGKDRVASILNDTVNERVREWTNSTQEGPQTWKEARQAREDAISVLAKAIFGDSIGVVDTELPTPALLKYFDKPQRLPFSSKIEASEAKVWGSHWEKLKEAIEKRTPEEQNKLRDNVEARRILLKGLMRGAGNQSHQPLGITFTKLALGAIKPPAEIEKTANLESIEEMKQAADAKVRSRIEEMIKLGASFTEARDMIQVTPGSVKKEIKETKDNNTFAIDPATIAAIGNVLTPVISALTERKKTEEILATALANVLNSKSEARNG